MTRRLPNLLGFVLLALSPAAVAAPVEQARSAVHVLDAYEASLRRAPTWSMRVDVNTRIEYPKADTREHDGVSIFRYTYYRDGDRVDVRAGAPSERSADGKPIPRPAGAPAGFRAIADGWFISYDESPGGSPRFVFYRSDGKRWLHRALDMTGAGALDGYLGDEFGIAEFFRAAKEVSVREAQLVDGHPCVQLDAAVPGHGHWVVWFDPAAGHLPRRIIHNKRPGDVWKGVSLADFARFMPHGSSAPTKMDEVIYTVDGLKFETIEGVLLPVACRVQEEQRYANGVVKTLTSDCRREDINLHPDLGTAGAFRPDLQEGRELVNEDDKSRHIVWRGGRPEPR